ncbi:hypothetical protein EVC45_06345 [Paraburkholderia sp. UYCP14C]|uniref:hypothetical protein n=1 Tax=Paraburkholderia sp. UYCP14C TaxID=2511130 RepID=UPI0010207B4E|nr:hypothetical protein [Paraburkholderia sp. UYCP14C]RZF30585.1 hypothetical protein EVC45_06345 [Paraburkholderia sp. UYCP14C]
MPTPTGSVPALSAASATVFSIGILFLGYWGLFEPTVWLKAHVVVVVLALAGFACLGLVPWMATSPVEPESSDTRIRIARHLFLAGVSAIWLAVATSVIF